MDLSPNLEVQMQVLDSSLGPAPRVPRRKITSRLRRSITILRTTNYDQVRVRGNAVHLSRTCLLFRFFQLNLSYDRITDLSQLAYFCTTYLFYTIPHVPVAAHRYGSGPVL